MNKPIKPNITIPESFAVNGVKTDFDSNKVLNGFDRLQPDVLAGDNLNKFIDDTYQGLNYGMAAADAINLINEGETLTVLNGELVSGATGGGSYVGQMIFSLDPLVEDGIHLPDGQVLPVGGIYNEFITKYIANLYIRQPQRFCTEEDWQASVSQYGVCGKYVYEAGVSVRLPKVTGFVEGTLDANALGDLVEQFVRLPNITGTFNNNGHADNGGAVGVTGAFTFTDTNAKSNDGSASDGGRFNFDASRCSSVYSGNGTDTKIQPQSIKGYMYIVVATTTKTDIEVDIDNIATDLNNKVDISNMVELPTIIETYRNGESGYNVYSDGYCEQWGRNPNTGTAGVTITLVKSFIDTNYNIQVTFNSTAPRAQAPAANKISTNQFGIYHQAEVNSFYWVVRGYVE